MSASVHACKHEPDQTWTAIHLRSMTTLRRHATGHSRDTDYNPTRVPWTVGANYEITDHMSVYGRVNRGYHFWTSTMGYAATRRARHRRSRVSRTRRSASSTRRAGIFTDITAYHRKVQRYPLYAQQTARARRSPPSSSNTDPIRRVSTPTFGDSDPAFESRPDRQLPPRSLYGLSRLHPVHNLVTGDGCAPIEGQTLQRQPKFRFALTPSYSVPVPWGDATAWVTYNHVVSTPRTRPDCSYWVRMTRWDFVSPPITATTGVARAGYERDERVGTHRE